MIKSISALIALSSISSIVLAHPEALYSGSVIQQVTHLLSPFHLATFGIAIAVLGFVTYLLRKKPKAQKIRHTDKKYPK